MKRLFKKYSLYLAGVAVFVLIAAVLRAVSIVRAAGSDGIKVTGPGTFLRALWLELKQAFMISRY